jgi:hypothetical protein
MRLLAGHSDRRYNYIRFVIPLTEGFDAITEEGRVVLG